MLLHRHHRCLSGRPRGSRNLRKRDSRVSRQCQDPAEGVRVPNVILGCHLPLDNPSTSLDCSPPINLDRRIGARSRRRRWTSRDRLR